MRSYSINATFSLLKPLKTTYQFQVLLSRIKMWHFSSEIHLTVILVETMDRSTLLKGTWSWWGQFQNNENELNLNEIQPISLCFVSLVSHNFLRRVFKKELGKLFNNAVMSYRVNYGECWQVFGFDIKRRIINFLRTLFPKLYQVILTIKKQILSTSVKFYVK